MTTGLPGITLICFMHSPFALNWLQTGYTESTQNPSSDSIWIEVCSGKFYATIVRDKTVIEILT